MSRRIEDLAPQFRDRFTRWIEVCEHAGLSILVTCTLRTDEEQNALYAQGRTKPGRIVTNARAGQSAHQYGLAMDFVPLVNGKPEWRGEAPEWGIAGGLAPVCGLEWAGAWVKFRELAHVQVANWRELVK